MKFVIIDASVTMHMVVVVVVVVIINRVSKYPIWWGCG